MGKKLFIHIGYPKTGTTTLQNYLFQRHPQIKYLTPLIHQTQLGKDIFFARENAIKRKRKEHKQSLQEILNSIKDREALVYSNESLMSISMFFRFSPTPFVWTAEPNSIARKLYNVFKDGKLFESVKIIITIRRQDELLKSMYAQVYNRYFKKFKETRSFVKFLDYALIHKDDFIMDALCYNEIISEYEKLFGEENVEVLLFEDLKSSQYSFIQKLTSFLDIDCDEAISLLENKHVNNKSGHYSYKTDDIKFISYVSRIKRAILGDSVTGFSNSGFYKVLEEIKIKGKSLDDIKINEEQYKQLKDIFSEGNDMLSKKRSLNLRKFGYL